MMLKETTTRKSDQLDRTFSSQETFLSGVRVFGVHNFGGT
jgi:hypothetical protein